MMGACEKARAYAPLILRAGLGVIFVYHGYGKVFGVGGFGTSWNPDMAVPLQAFVAWGELLGGLAVLSGFFVELGALVIAAIMVGAIVLVHAKNGFGMMNGGFEYNFALIVMAVSLMLSGPGPLALKDKCCKK